MENVELSGEWSLSTSTKIDHNYNSFLGKYLIFSPVPERFAATLPLRVPCAINVVSMDVFPHAIGKTAHLECPRCKGPADTR